MKRFARVSMVLASLTFAAAAFGAQEPHDHRSPAGRLGTVHFTTSCSKAVTQEFDRGIAALHSFWFSAAIDAFNGVVKSDPACAMAHWGIAMSWWGNPFGDFQSAQALKNGLAAVEKGKAAGGGGTERERAYLAAVEVLFKDAATIPQRTRTLEYEKRMAQLAAQHTGDPEARILYALALGQTAPPTDKTYANQLKAADILEKEFARQPEHPGLAHYIIHSYDVPALAPRALDAARRYARIAPAAPHALHMPSHTFTRVGAWQESIETNLKSAAAARKDGAAAEELHALDYQIYAYLQTAQDAAARKAMDGIAAIGARIQLDAPGAAAPPARPAAAIRPKPRRTSRNSSRSMMRSRKPATRTGPSRSKSSGASQPHGSRSPAAGLTKRSRCCRRRPSGKMPPKRARYPRDPLNPPASSWARCCWSSNDRPRH